MFRGFYLAVLAVSIVASIAAGPCAAGTFTTDDIEYEMPEGWFKGEHQGARAYFTMMRMGTTIAEMFLLDPSDKGGESRTYTFKDAVILLSVFLSELDGEAAVTSLMDELEAVRKSASSWSVQGRKVPVSLYAAAEGQALVTALFERDNLLIAVLLPKDEYKEAQGWIKRLITGVTFD